MAYQYLILDSRGNAVAHGISQQPPSGKLWCLLIDDGDIDRVMSHTHVSLVGSAESVPGLEGRIVRRDGNRVYLEPVRRLGEDVRKNLRIPVRFVSYLYPVSGRWKGRVPIVSKDLSCGGLAFYCTPQPGGGRDGAGGGAGDLAAAGTAHADPAQRAGIRWGVRLCRVFCRHGA
ncbi:MAG: hypothetical protein V8R55_12320 [Dysosmobacter sp.]